MKSREENRDDQEEDRKRKTPEEWENALKAALDIDYSYRLAKRMEEPKSNPVLGFRTAGSKAERETGELLFQEMKKLGLSDVHRDKVAVDSWEFHHAVMYYRDRKGTEHEFQLGAYQTNFTTDGSETFSLIYLGKGTALDYRNVDVKGKLVLVDINQRDEWWINFPVYQAHLKGAAALIAVQEQGYGEIHDTALNAQDIAGPAEAAAFSISRADAAVLKADMKAGMKADMNAEERSGTAEAEGSGAAEGLGGTEITVRFDASSRVVRDRESFNIVGTIPGQDPDSMILLSAHYDSYFSGFQDDNAAVAMMLGIAGAFLKTGYRPFHTLVFCAMAAEEWGVVDSKYDWSSGAYEQVFSARPEWQGRVIADLNFELPAHAHGRRDAVRCTYEYEDFVRTFLKHIEVDPEAYPEGVEVLCPIQTWSDDFSMAIAGIPSMVNDFSAGEFMETHYHSQFDNENFYQEPVYRFHLELYSCLLLALDRLAVVPLNFERLFEAAAASLDCDICRRAGGDEKRFLRAMEKARKTGNSLYKEICRLNESRGEIPDEGNENGELNSRLLHMFRKEQDYFVRLNWHDEVLFPQEAVQNNLRAIYSALECLERGEGENALNEIYGIDNNRYAFLFDEEVFRHFTEYVLNQPADRLKWGAGRIVHHENLFWLVDRLKKKNSQGSRDFEEEKQILLAVAESQENCYRDDIKYMIASAEKLESAMGECLKALSGNDTEKEEVQ